jgi:riboflavin kinase / FMN adenylyltransferase
VADAPRQRPLQVVQGIDGLTGDLGTLLVCVGVFDGLHRGHRYLLHNLVHEARARNARPAVITFDAHPDALLSGEAPPILCDGDERLVRFIGAGVQVVVIAHFDSRMRTMSYEAFVDAISSRTGLAGFVMTPDAAFGHERRGTPESVAALGRSRGFEVVVVPPLEIGGRPVRSSEIRNEIAAGELGGARELLGRPVAVAGTRRIVRAQETPGRLETLLEFELPVALPPAGTYPVRVASAWRLEGAVPQVPRGVGGRAVVTPEGALRVTELLPGDETEPALRLFAVRRTDLFDAPRWRVAFAGDRLD